MLGIFLGTSVFRFSIIEHVRHDIAENFQKIPLSLNMIGTLLLKSYRKVISTFTSYSCNMVAPNTDHYQQLVLTGLHITEVTWFKMAAMRCNNTLRYHKTFLFSQIIYLLGRETGTWCRDRGSIFRVLWCLYSLRVVSTVRMAVNIMQTNSWRNMNIFVAISWR
jgi:putative component of membrane protein insertase Oxa1/YidC/SpoIIIJ protein YidD